MAYTALYRKFRPLGFLDVKGQDAIVKTLSNQIKNERVGHAYLFCGTRGTGKTSVAKILARAVNCESPVDGSPCNECPVCRSILSGASMNVVEIDAASNNSVDNVRQIVEEVKYSPTEGRYRVYIIDEVHMLTPGAFNALLKTLEEPPSYVMFILATTEAHKIPITILSRCQRYDFKRISLDTIAARLNELCEKEGIKAEDGAIRYIARLGDGSMRDALSLMERCVSFFFNEEITYDRVLDVLGTTDIDSFASMLRYLKEGDVAGCMKQIEKLTELGRDLPRFVVDFTWYMRNLLLAGTGADVSDMLGMSTEQMQVLRHESRVFESGELIHFISICSELTNRLRFATQRRVLIETEFIRLCRPSLEADSSVYAERLRRLEREVEEIKKNGAAPAAKREEAALEPKKEIVKKAELTPAAVERIKSLVENWSNIKSEISSPLLRPVIISARPRVTPDGKLLIAFENIVDKGAAEERKQEIKEALEKYLEGLIDFDIVETEKAESASVDIYEYSKELNEEFGIPVDVI